MLVGTVSIEKSELISELLKKENIPHQVLNARYHEQEAYIIAEAGVPGAVTIATNMAGRGTDIQLGGNLQMRIQRELADVTDEHERERRIDKIKAEIAEKREKVLNACEVWELEPAKGSKPAKTITFPGGLYIIGTERHESRRIDNQLRGRAGRQGDPGRSKFYLSLEDDLMRIFASRAHGHHAEAPGPEGRRGDRASLGQQGAGKGAAEGRGAQLRHPQEPAQVRQRDERPAQGHL